MPEPALAFRPLPRHRCGMDLRDKVALVTGAARGVGAIIAKHLVEAGARVVLTDVREEDGRQTAEDLGPSARFCRLDVTEEPQWTSVLDAIVQTEGRIDVLVNNAAVLHLGALATTTSATFRRLLDVNTTGPFLGTRAVAPHMIAGGGGAIVNIGSVDGMFGNNGLSAYVTSKFGLRGLTKAAALELGRDGIRVNYVASGGGNPEMYAPWMEQMMSFLEETVAYQNDRAIPGGAPPEAIANAVVFLASDAAAHITGIELPVDNGATAGHFIPGFNRL